MDYKRVMKVAKSILRQGNVELLRDVEKIKDSLSRLEKKHRVSSQKMLNLVKGDLLVPITIFRPELSVLESVVKYLKENRGYNFHEIGSLLARNERNIWHAYTKANKKYSKKIVVKKTDYFIPVSIFTNRKLSPLEAVVDYLENFYKLDYRKIASLLQKTAGAIWTVLSRLKSKK